MDNNYFNKDQQLAAEVKSNITIALVLGILGIVLTFLSGFIGLILAIICLVMVNKTNKTIEANPAITNYIADDLGKLNIAKILSIISCVAFGVILVCSCGFGVVYGLIMFVAMGASM